MRVTKKSSHCVIFFGKSCKPVTRITAKKNKITRLDDFFVHPFTAKKKLDDLMIFLYTHLVQKKIARLDDFFVHLFNAKKNYRT